MKLKKFTIFFALSIVGLLFMSPVHAEGGNLEVNVDSAKETIDLTWNEVGDTYTLFQLSGSEWYEIWSGGQSQYRLDNLASNTLYRFRLEVYDQSNRLIDTAIINTSTHKSEQDISSYLQSNAQMLSTFSDEQAEISYPMVDSNETVVIYQDRVKLNWSNIPTENNEFEIYRNGEHLAEIEGNEYVDKNVKNSEIYRYTVVGKKKLPQDRIDRIRTNLNKQNIELSKEEQQKAFYERKEATSIVNTSGETVMEKAKTKQSNSPNDFYPDGYGWLLRYTTFIPMQYAENPWCTVNCTYEYFGGDNRGFDFWADSFRTRSDTYVLWDWNGNLKGVEHNPQTGITYGYDGNYNLIGSGQADADADHDIWLTDSGSNWFHHRMRLASSNPLTVAPNIDAFYYSTVYENGTGEFYGVHDLAPSHEFYIANYPGDFVVPIHTRSHQGFEHLFPGFPTAEFNVTLN